MPRIPCQVRRQFKDAKMPFVTISVSSKSPPIRTGTTALLDTGSPYTGMSPRDLLKSRMRMKLAKGETIELAGMKFFAPVMKEAIIRLRTEEGKTLSYEVDDMRAFVPTRIDDRIMRKAQDIPTIVGVDFLEAHGLALFFDPKAQEAYLEAPSE